jgi:hypothetical protein
MRQTAPAPKGCHLKNCHTSLLLHYLERLNLVSRAWPGNFSGGSAYVK